MPQCYICHPESTKSEIKEGDHYWYLNSCYDLEKTINTAKYDKNRIACGNAFLTRRLAELYKLRLKALAAPRWKPEPGKGYSYWNFERKEAVVSFWFNDDVDFERLMLGNIHHTKADAEAWGAKYHEAFMVLTEPAEPNEEPTFKVGDKVRFKCKCKRDEMINFVDSMKHLHGRDATVSEIKHNPGVGCKYEIYLKDFSDTSGDTVWNYDETMFEKVL